MKKFAILAMAFVLTAGVMAGCRRNTSNETAGPDTTAATHATTVPTTAATHSTAPTATHSDPADTGIMDSAGKAARKIERPHRLP